MKNIVELGYFCSCIFYRWLNYQKNLFIFLIFFICISNTSYCLFNRNESYSKSEPIGHNMSFYDIYLGAGAGFNLFHLQSYNAFFSNINGISGSAMNVRYTPYFIFYLGFYDKKRAIRHEIEFNYMVSATSITKYGDGVSSATGMIVNGTSIDKYSIFSQKFAFFYNFIKEFGNLISFTSKYKINVFAGLGAGFIIQKNYLYAASSWSGETLTDNGDINYISPDIASTSIVSTSKAYLSAGFQVILGMSFDIASAATAQIRLKYQLTTKPFFNVSMGNFYHGPGNFINSHLIGLDMAILLKVL